MSLLGFRPDMEDEWFPHTAEHAIHLNIRMIPSEFNHFIAKSELV